MRASAIRCLSHLTICKLEVLTNNARSVVSVVGFSIFTPEQLIFVRLTPNNYNAKSAYKHLYNREYSSAITEQILPLNSE
jgi:hypothetical protein